MNEIFSQSVENLALKIKNSELTSVELCEKYIERIDKFEKEVKAWAYIDKKTIIEKAEEKDEYRKTGKPLGPLHGLPIGLKDIIGTQDMPTECGTVLRKGKTQSKTRKTPYVRKGLVKYTSAGDVGDIEAIKAKYKITTDQENYLNEQTADNKETL